MRPPLLLVVLAACGFPTSGGGAALLDASPGPRDDGGVIDGPRVDFDAARDCPASYLTEGLGGSRYRIVMAAAEEEGGEPEPERGAYPRMAQRCAGDSAGLTHLLVPDVAGELAWARQHLIDDHDWTWAYVGVVRDVDAPSGSPTAGWRDVHGGSPTAVPWAAAQPFDYDEPPLAMALTPAEGGVSDVSQFYELAAFCECDGRAPLPE